MSSNDEVESAGMDLTLLDYGESYSSDDADEEEYNDVVLEKVVQDNNDDGSNDDDSKRSFVVTAKCNYSQTTTNNIVTKETIESMQHSIRFLKDRMSDMSKSLNELKMNYTKLEGLLKTVMTTNVVSEPHNYFEGDYVVLGLEIGKVIKVFKRTVHVKTDATSKEYQVWNTKDICKCNEIANKAV